MNVQPQDLSERDWADIDAIATEVREYLSDLKEHRRSQIKYPASGEVVCVRDHVRECLCPKCGERFARLPREEAEQISSERLKAFRHKGVRIVNVRTSETRRWQ